jgi:hypothetical protein
MRWILYTILLLASAATGLALHERSIFLPRPGLLGQTLRWLPLATTAVLIILGVHSTAKSRLDWRLGVALVLSM